ncbi:MAG: Glyoxalase/bleomycin resistance protein/dioxygenase [Chloroflexi bacterium]|nr:Glyoxalase/bleomycin resistance protein/dioxygenase [Chloroflexota bacterium]
MANLRHIAFISEEPPVLFDYCHHLFGMEKVRTSESGGIHVVDPLFNLAFLKQTRSEAEVVGTHRADGSEADQRLGINHFGFIVDDVADLVARLPEAVRFGDSPQNGRPAEVRVIDPWGNNFDLSSRGFLGREEARLPGIRFVAVHNDHPEEAAEFYGQVLGLRETRRSAEGAIRLTDGTVTLCVTTDQVLDRSGIQYFGIHAANWNTIADRYRDLGVSLPSPHGPDDEVRMKDPEGNMFVLSAEGW